MGQFADQGADVLDDGGGVQDSPQLLQSLNVLSMQGEGQDPPRQDNDGPPIKGPNRHTLSGYLEWRGYWSGTDEFPTVE
jgi:hypothetical protein